MDHFYDTLVLLVSPSPNSLILYRKGASITSQNKSHRFGMMWEWIYDDNLKFWINYSYILSGLQHFPWEMTPNIKPSVETNLHILGILLLELTARLVTHSRGKSRAARHRCTLAWREAPLTVLARPAEKLQHSSTLLSYMENSITPSFVDVCGWITQTLSRPSSIWKKRMGIGKQEKLPFMKTNQYS